MMVELTPELIKALSKTRNGFYSWDYVAGLAYWIIGVEAENERLRSENEQLLEGLQYIANMNGVIRVDYISRYAEKALKEVKE